MRKVLLASTALATAAGVAAVANAEVSISGASEWHYESVSDDNTAHASSSAVKLGNTVTVSFSAATDNGLTYSMYYLMGDSTGSEASISGDFGKIKLCDGSTGGACGAGGDYDVTSVGFAAAHGDPAFALMQGGADTTTVTAVEIDEAQIDDTIDTAGATIEYHSPSFNGFAFGVSSSHLESHDDNTSMSMGASYSGSAGDISYSIGVASYDGTHENTEGDHIGFNVGMGDMTFGFGSSTNKSTNSKKDTISYSVNYAMTDDITINVGRTDSENKGGTGATDDKEAANTVVGVKYVIAPGLYATLASHSFEYKENGSVDNDGQALLSEIKMSW